MSFVLTYNSLFQAVEYYLERSDAPVIAEIPLFIMLGERRVARDLKILGLKVFVTDNLIVGDQTLTKPARWLNTSTFNIGINVGTDTEFNTRKQIPLRSYEFARQYWPNPVLQGEPKYISDYDFAHLLIVPTPDDTYPYEFAYYELPSLIDPSADGQTNWITTNAPDILLYATLLETASYLKDDERVPVWTNYYDKAKAALNTEDMARIYDAFSKRGA